MSRMLAYVAAEPMSSADALDDRLLAQFAALARLHADGWGTAWLDGSTGVVRSVASADAPVGGAEWMDALAVPSTARMIYLRFASRGAAPAPENSQPFHRDSRAFQHNGLLSPREDLLDLLDLDERAALRGTTDSEAYFAVLRGFARGPAGWAAPTIARGVARVRTRFYAACLNAMLLSESGLFVVHAPGTVPAPLGAFAARGADLDTLPPGHDEDYNTLRTTTRGGGVRLVATTGVDHRDWTRLDDESVFEIAHGGVVAARI